MTTTLSWPTAIPRAALLAVGTAVHLFPGIASAATGPDVNVVARNYETKAVVTTFSTSREFTIGHDADVRFYFEAKPGERVDRVYAKVAPGADPGCMTLSGQTARVDSKPPYAFGFRPMPDCRWVFTVHDDAARTKTELNVRVRRALPHQTEPQQARRYDLIRGAHGTANLAVGALTTIPGHGVRIGCTVSHFAYDDPIVFPGQPNKAHLHMFLGNTSANAYSTLKSLKAANQSSCHGGKNMESAYWMPALFDENDRAVVPEHFMTYYKTFVFGNMPIRLPKGLIKPIPDGLEMLSGPSALNFDQNRDLYRTITEENGLLKIQTAFPQCVAVHPDGRPVLSHRDMPGEKAKTVNSHMAYHLWGTGQQNSCPSSHPYRIPGVFYNAWYDVDINSRWYLSSDTDRSRPGHSLHADYMAAWNKDDMARVVQCNEERRSCLFNRHRPQDMPNLLVDWSGKRVYLNTWVLESGQSRTPWNRSLTKMHPGMTMTH